MNCRILKLIHLPVFCLLQPQAVDWHPIKSLLVSGSKDNQQPIKLWDPRNGTSLATIHAHKNTVMDLKWNRNGNWLLTASRDHLIKIFDIRNLAQEMQTFRGHKKEACCESLSLLMQFHPNCNPLTDPFISTKVSPGIRYTRTCLPAVAPTAQFYSGKSGECRRT